MATHISSATSSIPSALLLQTLHNLDGYLAATNHAADHPWRNEIATAVAVRGTSSYADGGDTLIIDSPYSRVHLEPDGLHDHAVMRASQLRGLLYGMRAADVTCEMMALAYELSADLAEEIHANNFHTLRAGQLPMLLLSMQDWEGPDDMLWLCQQFSDELRAVLAALVAQQAAGVAA